MVKVSVIVPVFNSEDTLETTFYHYDVNESSAMRNYKSNFFELGKYTLKIYYSY